MSDDGKDDQIRGHQPEDGPPDQGLKRCRSPSDCQNFDDSDECEFVPFTQAREFKKVVCDQSEDGPSGEGQKRGRGPSDCLNWDDSDEDEFWSLPQTPEPKKVVYAKKSAPKKAKNSGPKSSSAKARSALKGKSGKSWFCRCYFFCFFNEMVVFGCNVMLDESN